MVGRFVSFRHSKAIVMMLFDFIWLCCDRQNKTVSRNVVYGFRNYIL